MGTRLIRIEVVLRRGSIDESRHRVQVAVSRADGTLTLESEEPRLETTFRSAAKPFQLLPLVERGHADAWNFTGEELAVAAASHTGSARHLALVRGLLSRLGLGPEHLVCGFHDPLDPESLAHLAAHPAERSSLYNNCSGKHAAMLCLARSEGWPVEGYERADHPLQRLMRQTVAEVAGLPAERLSLGIDGCGVNVFGLPLADMARAYARFAAASPGGDARERSLARIRAAMCEHPVLTGGAGRLSSALMEVSRGRLLAKGGAEGLECVGIPQAQLGVAIKVEDGSTRAVGPAVVAVLERIGALDAAEAELLSAWARPTVTNYAGAEVGSLEARVVVTADA